MVLTETHFKKILVQRLYLLGVQGSSLDEEVPELIEFTVFIFRFDWVDQFNFLRYVVVWLRRGLHITSFYSFWHFLVFLHLQFIFFQHLLHVGVEVLLRFVFGGILSLHLLNHL